MNAVRLPSPRELGNSLLIALSLLQFSLQGRVALVTGGNSGIGLAITGSLAAAGAKVAVFDITPPTPEYLKVSTLYKDQMRHYVVDVSDLSRIRDGFKGLSQDFDGNLDIAILCAGLNFVGDFLDTSLEQFDRLIGVNVRGVYFTAQQAAKQMIDSHTSHGSIIMIASTSAHVSMRTHNSSAYATTKSAVKGMVPDLAKELAPHNIRVNSISPGYTLTPMTRGSPEFLKLWSSDVMLGRIANPEDYGGPSIFLASDASKHITGQDLLVDGGSTKW
jgi:NAD(P)-dependent dehydrogenase (short-subunit alcohol dehydrogenase family)